MKTTAFTPKGIKFLYFLLLAPLFFSCSPEMYNHNYDLNGSFDAYRRKYTGPSYPSASGDKARPAYNMAGYTNYMPEHFPHDKSTVMNYHNYNDQDLLHGPSATEEDGYDDMAGGAPGKNIAPKGLKSHLGFSGGIEFIQKKSADDGTISTLNYLEVPVYALYYYQLPSSDYIFGGLGPYLAYGIGGKTKTTFNGRETETKSFDKTSGDKRFDAGLSLTAGYRIYNSFSFRFAYDLGLVNIERNAFGDKTKNRGFSINVSYPLDRIFKHKQATAPGKINHGR